MSAKWTHYYRAWCDDCTEGKGFLDLIKAGDWCVEHNRGLHNGAPPRCTSEHRDPRLWSEARRCTLPKGHSGLHKGMWGDVWSLISLEPQQQEPEPGR